MFWISKVISGLSNFDPTSVAKVVKAATEGGEAAATASKSFDLIIRCNFLISASIFRCDTHRYRLQVRLDGNMLFATVYKWSNDMAALIWFDWHVH